MALSDVQPDERDVSDEGSECERLVALRRYGVLDTPAEAAFDDLTRLAAAICEVPIAVINLIDATRQWFKSEIGFGTRETPLEMSICRHAMLQGSLVVVPDLRVDARFAGNPRVEGAPGLRAYAGAPLETADGHVLGMLCVLDLKPRVFSSFQTDALQTLARQVMALLELRRSESQAKAQRAQLEEQELQWQAALMSAQLGVWRLDFATQAVSVNASFASVLGLPPETSEFDAPWFLQLTHPDDQAKVAALAEQALQRHEPLEGEYRILRQDDGSIRWLLTRSQVVRDAEGRPVAMLGGNVDITKRKLAEHALATYKQRLRLAAEAAGLFSWEIDAATRQVVVPENYLKATGRARVSLDLPTLLDEVVHPDDLPRVRATFERAFADHAPLRFECRSLSADGQTLHLRHTGAWVHDDNGAPRALVAVSQDITEEKRQTERDSYRLHLADALRPLTDAAAIQRASAQALGEHFGAWLTCYTQVEDDQRHAVVLSDWQAPGAPSLVGRHDLERYGPAFLSEMRAGHTLAVEDTESAPQLSEGMRANYALLGVRATAIVPLIKGGRMVGQCAVCMHAPQRWRPDELALIEETAERTWAALERARAEAALRRAERDYHTLFMGTPTPFLLLAPDPAHFTIVEVNDAYLAVTMRTREQLIGRPLFEAFPDNPAEATSTQVRTLRTSLEHVLSSKRTDVLPRFKYEIARPDGSFEERWWDPVNTPLLDERGGVVALLHHATDVTEQHFAERAECERQARQAFLLKLSDALRPLGDAVGIQSEATRLLREHFEAGWCYYAEFDASGTAVQILRDSVREGLPSLAGHHEMQDLPELLAHLSAGEMMNAPDLSAFPFFNQRVVDRYTAIGMHSFVSTPLLKHGQLLAFLMLADTRTRHWNDDATDLLAEVAERTWAAVERAQAQAALRTSELALRDADRRKDEFLATLAHELRNPLAPVRNSLHILRLVGADVARQAPLLDMMERQLGHMVRLVDDLMEVSRITRGKIELQRRTLDLADVLRSAAETAGPQLQAARVTLRLELPPEALLVEADAVRLAQIFANLLHNAAKYTDAGGQVTVALSSENGQAVAAVRDSGTGIPAEMLPRVFELFTQVDRTLGRAQGGLGIGLALVKNLVGLHGGSVEARSDGPGLGSEFTVRLPLAAAAPAVGEAATGPTADAHWLAGRRVLVVDDNRDAADSLAALLAYFGADVRTAYDGPAALLAASEQRPEAVLLDLGMPGMDGYAVATQLRSEPQYQAMKLIALTGWGQQEDLQRTRAAGFDEHLVKPVAPERVLELLRAATTEGKRARGLPEPDTAPTA